MSDMFDHEENKIQRLYITLKDLRRNIDRRNIKNKESKNNCMGKSYPQINFLQF